MTAKRWELSAAMGLRNALARRIAREAISGKLPGLITSDLYGEYEATVAELCTEIMDSAKVPVRDS
jgi:histone H3/H4